MLKIYLLNKGDIMKLIKCLLFTLAFMLIASLLFANSNSIIINFQMVKTTKTKLIMGDKISFKSSITNLDNHPIKGLVGWISLIDITKGDEQPMDLEDWSAHKAISKQILKPGETIETKWPMRLIKSGDYRVFVSITSRDTNEVITSSSIDFHVYQKPVISSKKVLFVALFIPFILLIVFVYRKKATVKNG
jgi:hypothetical protein